MQNRIQQSKLIIYNMFEEEKEQKITQKIIHFIQNGHPEKLFTQSFSKPLSKCDIEALCDKQWGGGGRYKSMRFFSLEGVEIMEEDLAYVRNGSRIYVSKGEDFDADRNFGEYKLIRQLGQGGFGKVWLAQSSINNSLAAIKILKLEKITGAHDIDQVFRQVETLKVLSHPHIVKILNCYTLSNMQLVVVMEYLAGGELLALLKEKTVFEEQTARKVFLQIVEAVSHCHREGIIHRDLKLENVLLENKEDLKIKVADFGISGVADTLNPDVDVGTLRYMAPEVLNRKEKSNTAAVDVWACGVMLYCMVFGKLPFAEPSSAATTQAIIHGKYSFPKSHVSLECQDLITQMLTYDPKSRPSMNEIQGHPWVLGTMKSQIEDRIIETEPEEAVKFQPHVKQNKKLNDFRKRLPLIPKRLQKQKEQVLEELRCMKGGVNSRARLLKSETKWGGASPRYMNSIKCKEEEERPGGGVRRKRSFVTALWK